MDGEGSVFSVVIVVSGYGLVVTTVAVTSRKERLECQQEIEI